MLFQLGCTGSRMSEFTRGSECKPPPAPTQDCGTWIPGWVPLCWHQPHPCPAFPVLPSVPAPAEAVVLGVLGATPRPAGGALASGPQPQLVPVSQLPSSAPGRRGTQEPLSAGSAMF